MEELFTVQEVAAKLKLSVSTLYRYVENDIIPHKKLGRKIRFTNAQVAFILNQNENGGNHE
jgi:excisionase family DNA binding protein